MIRALRDKPRSRKLEWSGGTSLGQGNPFPLPSVSESSSGLSPPPQVPLPLAQEKGFALSHSWTDPQTRRPSLTL